MAGLIVLFVAPHREGMPVLDTKAEAERISNILTPVGGSISIMSGSVTLNEFALRMVAGGPVDVVVIAGHGLPGELVFTDSSATPQWLASLFRVAGPRVVILSTCYSASRDSFTMHNAAEEIASSGITVAAMVRSVEDAAAVVYDAEFIRAYQNEHSAAIAHQIAIEQSRQVSVEFSDSVILLPGSSNGTTIENCGRLLTDLESTRESITSLEGKISQLYEVISTGHGHIAVAEIKELRTAIRDLMQVSNVQGQMIELLKTSQAALIETSKRLQLQNEK